MKPTTTTPTEHQALVGGACGTRRLRPIHPVRAAYGIDPCVATGGFPVPERASSTGFAIWNSPRRLEAFVT